MANVSFTRGTDASVSASTTTGLLTFNTANSTISLGTGSEAVPFQCMNRLQYIYGKGVSGTLTNTEQTLVDGSSWNHKVNKNISVPGIVVYFSCSVANTPHTNWGTSAPQYNINHSTSTANISASIDIYKSYTDTSSSAKIPNPTFNYVIGYIPIS